MTEEGRRLLAAATERPWYWEGEFDKADVVNSNGPDLMSGDGVVLGAWGHDAYGVGVHEDDAALIVAAVNQYAALLDLWEAAIGTVARIDAAADQGYDVSPDPALADLLREPLAALQASRDSTPDPLE